MRRVVYSPAGDRLVYLHQQATPEYWDAHWRAQGKPAPVGPRDDVVVVTRRHLPVGARVLEGGCGRANKVRALLTMLKYESGVNAHVVKPLKFHELVAAVKQL